MLVESSSDRTGGFLAYHQCTNPAVCNSSASFQSLAGILVLTKIQGYIIWQVNGLDIASCIAPEGFPLYETLNTNACMSYQQKRAIPLPYGTLRERGSKLRGASPRVDGV
ncbi:MAG: hypothetical protein V7K48_27400 [Nostoc sp.]|uniref:hypothetical protein n=1 Tax=Nostoc sp. TaxID=1180 RepID=UPI002FF6CAA2